MPGAWELQHHDKNVLVATLHTDVTTMAWAYGFRNLIIPGNLPPIGLAGMPFDHARNAACMQALEMGADFVFHLDSDVVPCRDAILRLMAHDVPIISGLYCRRSPPWSIPVMIRNGSWVTDFVPGSVIEVDFVGAGALLLRRDFLEKFPPMSHGHHWFDWRVDMQGQYPSGECLSEDFAMCLHAKRSMGVKTLVDTGVICRHIGFAQSTFGSFTPLDTVAVT